MFDIEARRKIARPLPPVASAIREAAWLARKASEEAAEAWLKREDPRAVQGGATCLEADEWREIMRALNALVLDAEELEPVLTDREIALADGGPENGGVTS